MLIQRRSNKERAPIIAGDHRLTDALRASYEAVPYDSRPIGASEIGALETIALLHGIAAPRADRARVLELGCASGGNLIPMAYRYPDATFVGIDLTPGQIAMGNVEVDALDLANITLRSMSIVDITDDFGLFDYIICHGVYSWVPPEVQEAILRVASRNLAPDGLAYISYNTLPGWHARGMVREMMMYHDDPSLGAQERVARATDFVHLLTTKGSTPASLHTLSLMEEEMNLRSQGEAHLLHEQLESYNSPLYLSEFVRRAAASGLRYVAEAKIADRATPEWARVAAAGDTVRAQQYLDFATGRTFRRSLLCHANALVQPELNVECVPALHVTLRAEPTTPAEEDASKVGVEAFKSSTTGTMTTNNPLVLAAFHVLMRVAPASLPFEALLQRVNDRLSVDEPPGLPAPEERVALLSSVVLQCAVGGFLDLHRYPSPCVRSVSSRPVASRIARRMVASSAAVSNLRHAIAELTRFERVLLGDLDGAHDRDALLDLMLERIRVGDVEVEGDVPARAELGTLIDTALARLAGVALLEA
jgi:methyltransferase-like protein